MHFVAITPVVSAFVPTVSPLIFALLALVTSEWPVGALVGDIGEGCGDGRETCREGGRGGGGASRRWRHVGRGAARAARAVRASGAGRAHRGPTAAVCAQRRRGRVAALRGGVERDPGAWGGALVAPCLNVWGSVPLAQCVCVCVRFFRRVLESYSVAHLRIDALGRRHGCPNPFSNAPLFETYFSPRGG